MLKKFIACILAGAMLSAFCIGCGAGNGTGSGKTAETEYNTLYSSEVSTLNYLKTSTVSEMTIPANTIDTLVETDSKGNIVPCLATEWSQDGLTWTFKLRQGVKWVDNTGKEVAEVTAQDFVDALKYQLTPENEAANAQNLFGVIKNAEEYYKGLSKTADDDGKTYPEVDFSEVGVKAVDKYTLQYTLSKEIPYFLSSLVYVVYMPAYGPLLEEKGKDFATTADSMYYCGAYYLSDFEPQVKNVLTKNELYWDADKVYITKVNSSFNSEETTIAPEMVKRGEIDNASITSDILDDWLSNDSTKNLVSKTRPKTDYSYFYCFNFKPEFGKEYEPDNWKLAVNNENFRKALMASLNRTKAVAVNEPNNPEEYLENTITPKTFAENADKTDYTALEPFKDIMAADSYNEDKAKEYKEKAIAELKAEGASFPVKVLMKYNPSAANWDKECEVVKQQMEEVLGTDFINIIVEAGPSDSFLSKVRRSGDYAFMKCGWGADYKDPESWTDPFYEKAGTDGFQYEFLRNAVNENTKTAPVIKEYFKLVEDAKKITGTDDTNKRYEAFAKAEAYLIEHALAVPYGISISSYTATKLNVFESEYSSCGTVPLLRYKGMHKQKDFVSLDQYEENKKKNQK